MTEENSIYCILLDDIKHLYSLRIALILTCCFNETDALLDKHWDGPLRSDHGDQRHTKVVAFNGFRDGMSGFGSRFLKK